MADPRAFMRVYAQLKGRIESGQLAADTRLNIGLVADEFDVSRDTVQHALQLLADDGLVERYAGLGWYVQEPPPDGGGGS
jgi:DNA-binding GntR family transcriptional regulator